MKTCKDCLQDKSLDDYYKNPAGRDGHQNRCKECSKAAKRLSNLQRGIYKGRKYKQGTTRPPRAGVVDYDQHWAGVEKTDELAIYVLKTDGDVFWVGSTIAPSVRYTTHQQRWGFPFEMVVLRWVPKKYRVVEESKEMIKQFALGAQLLNKLPPRNR